MKKYFLLLMFSALGLTGLTAQQPAAEITFAFTRLGGIASNQFAVWIEDSQGKYIKTLYAARYTANGGWKRRETSLPLWVKKSGISEMNKSQIDVLTGATPKTGILSYSWDGTDSRGSVVPSGDYIIILEGTLRWENQVYYRANLRIGQGPSSPAVSVNYTGDSSTDRAMIGDVKIRTLR